MEQKPSLNKPAAVVALLLLLVLILLLAAFIIAQPGGGNKEIVLPAEQPESAVSQKPEAEGDSGFIRLTADNVLPMLRSIVQPSYYHQVYHVYVTAQRGQSSKRVELWRSGELLRAEIDDGTLIQYLLTDGNEVWLWYSREPSPICLERNDAVQIEDLLGLPAFDYLKTLADARIVDAEYQVLEDTKQQCVYVCAQNENGSTNRYWIDMHTGLLYLGDALEQSRQVYEIRQNEVSILAAGDQAFADRFCLPDGTDPFTAETEMPQP